MKIARGMPRCLGHLPRDLGLHLDAFDRGDDEQREVGGLQRGGDVADEVGVAGRVDDVDLVAVVLERREGERHRDAAPLLLGIEVAGGRCWSSTRPRRGIAPAVNSRASAREVLPAPPWPTRATLRIFAVGNVFTNPPVASRCG